MQTALEWETMLSTSEGKTQSAIFWVGLGSASHALPLVSSFSLRRKPPAPSTSPGTPRGLQTYSL